jgi:ribosome maturation factor RimP
VTKEEIERLINEAAESLGFVIYESSMLLKGENTKISVKIDNLGVVSHRDCEDYSKELSRIIDESGALPNFTLEVSSPGFKRKLRNMDEFRRFIDSPVKIVYNENEEGRVVKGMIKDVKEELVELECEGKVVSISFNSIAKANLDY